MPAIEGGEIDVPNEEPLKRELEDFVQAVATAAAAARHGRAGPPRAGAGAADYR